jgi:hypothetical protein
MTEFHLLTGMGSNHTQRSASRRLTALDANRGIFNDEA